VVGAPTGNLGIGVELLRGVSVEGPPTEDLEERG